MAHILSARRLEMALPQVENGYYRCAVRTAILREETEHSPSRARAVHPSAAGPRRRCWGSIPGESSRAIQACRDRLRCAPAAGSARNKENGYRPVETAANCDRTPGVTRPDRSPAQEFRRSTGHDTAG